MAHKAKPGQTNRRAFMRRLVTVSGAAMVGGVPLAATASAQRRISRMRLSATHSKTRLVFDLDGPVQHSLFALNNPARLVIDVEDARFSGSSPNTNASALIRGIRKGTRHGDDLRVVLDLQRRVRAQSFLLKPDGKRGYRLVVDLLDPKKSNKNKEIKKFQDEKLRDVVVAIDPGHGGRDPGATGKHGTHEKVVALAVGRRLAKLIDQQSGMRAVLIRDKDRFVTLRERVRRAHEARADILVSLHTDAFRDARAKGASVYALSLRGASSEAARRLADRENAADLLGGVSLKDKDDLVASVLLDLAQTATIESSVEVGDHILRNIKRLGRVHKSRVQQAGFTVLKNPDIPSVLIEMAFISNPREEKKLRTSAHQQKLAKAITHGLRTYFAHKAPPGTLLSQRGIKSVG
jgi:N-acetylmuramoyl-L-alanine amidase